MASCWDWTAICVYGPAPRGTGSSKASGASAKSCGRSVNSLKVDCVAAEKRIRPYVIETPLERSAWLSSESGAEVFLKLENLQDTGAFKLRGATHKLLSLTPAQAARGVVTASSGGNHALAVAATGARLGIATEV